MATEQTITASALIIMIGLGTIGTLFSSGYFDTNDKFFCKETNTIQQCKSLDVNWVICIDNTKIQRTCNTGWSRIIVDKRPSYVCDTKKCIKQ